MVMIGRNIKRFFTGSPTKVDQVSNLRPEQEDLYQQYQNSLQNVGPNGPFQPSIDYYKGILNNDSADFDQFAAPEMRRFNQQIVPGLAEQFAGMGAGALDSSGFQNALGQAGADLSERLAAMRAGLRQNAAQGLYNIGQGGFAPFSQNQVTEEGSEGFAPAVSKGLGKVAGLYIKSKMGAPGLPPADATAAAGAPGMTGATPQMNQPAYWATGNSRQRMNGGSGSSYNTSPYGNQGMNRSNPMQMNRL